MPVFWRRFLVFLALWLLFEASISWLATCQPYYDQAASYSGEKYNCTLLNGPLVSLSIYGTKRLWTFLAANEHELVAGFTIVLAFSTVFLWISTKRLWETTKAAAAAQAEDMQKSIRASETAAREARKANDLTRDIFIADQRPWLQWTVPKIGNLKINGPRISVQIDGSFHNLGRIPAENVSYFGKLFVPDPSVPVDTSGKAFFDEHMRQADIGFVPLATILPNETVPFIFTPEGIEVASLPDNFTLYLAFHTFYLFALGSAYRQTHMGEIGALYAIIPFGNISSAYFKKADVKRSERSVSIVEFTGSRRLT